MKELARYIYIDNAIYYVIFPRLLFTVLSWEPHDVVNYCRYVYRYSYIVRLIPANLQSAKLSSAQDDRLQIIYLLHEVGADVTVESAPGETPFVLALDLSINFKIGAVLLGMCSQITYFLWPCMFLLLLLL